MSNIFFEVLDVSYIKPASGIDEKTFWKFPHFNASNIKKLKRYGSYLFRKDHPATDYPRHPLCMIVSQMEDGGYFKITYTFSYSEGHATMWDALKYYASPLIIEPPAQSKITLASNQDELSDLNNQNNHNTNNQGENTMKIRVIKKQIKDKIKTLNAKIEQAAKIILTDAQTMTEHGNVTPAILEDISNHAAIITQLQQNIEKISPYAGAQEIIMDEEEYANFTNL